MNSQKLGIDEAGRGCVLGPLVMAGLRLGAEDMEFIQTLGVQDSKLFGSTVGAKKKRALLYEQLRAYSHHVEIAEADEVDDYVRRGGLNDLERSMASKIIAALPGAQVMLDGAVMFGPLCNDHIKAENKADQNHLEVAAASIIAKHVRDEAISALLTPFEPEFGKVKGGGYANQGTLAFVEWHVQKRGELPLCLRTSYQWKAIAHLR